MQRSTVVILGIGTFALALSSFLVLGTTRLVLGPERAMILAAPLGILAVVLAMGLFVRLTLAAIGLWPIEADSAADSGRDTSLDPE